MGLFSTLKQETSTTSSLSLPTVVQLYTSAPFRLESTVQLPSYAVLTYQAVQVTATETMTEQKGLRSKKQSYPVPDLGVWDCCIAKRQEGKTPPLSDSLLKIPERVSTFCFTVDLSKSTEVEPTITLLQEALVRYLIDRSAEGEDQNIQPATATTTLYQLRSVQFGLAPQDDKSAESLTKSAPDEKDRKVAVALMICAKLAPKKQTEEDYREKQAQALMIYHLRRYAAALNASLCFVGPPTEDKEEQPTMSLTQLAYAWRELAQGRQVWKDQESPELAREEEEESAHSLIYGPGTHNEELIESVLQRNANYPGHWDAAKESVWRILPPESETATTSTTKNKTPAGDEHWLTELRDSVAAAEAIKTPPPKKPDKESGSTQKTPNDAAAFFESLLK